MIRSEAEAGSPSSSATPVRISPVERIIPQWTYPLFLLLVLEIVLQGYYRITTGSFLYHRDKPPIWVADSASVWTNRPNISYRHSSPEFEVDLHTNSEGFRVSPLHEEYSRDKKPGAFRVLLLGPSFAYGWGVNFDDTFGVQLQRILQEKRVASGQSIEVLNHGVPALPAANQLEWFRNIGKHYSPDLVIHFVYASLEVNPQPDRSLTVANGQLLPIGLGPVDFIWGYAKNSATIFYAGIIIGQIGKIAGAAGQGGRIEGAGRELHAASTFDVHSATIKKSTAFYRDFQEAIRESGANFLIVHFPLAYVVYPEDRARWALHGVENIEAQVAYNKAYAEHLNQQTIPCLNLTQDLVEEARRDARRLYYWLDVHWTPAGNRRSAELVGRYLERTYRGRASGADDSRGSAREQ